MEHGLETATLGGGCFWCLEAVYQQVDGVVAVESGYTGGHVDHPTYQQVCEGDTGHVEVVRVTFNPSVINFRQILEIFFAIHDPTTPDRQGNDAGPQYRSAIFTHSEAQRATAEYVMREWLLPRFLMRRLLRKSSRSSRTGALRQVTRLLSGPSEPGVLCRCDLAEIGQVSKAVWGEVEEVGAGRWSEPAARIRWPLPEGAAYRPLCAGGQPFTAPASQ